MITLFRSVSPPDARRGCVPPFGPPQVLTRGAAAREDLLCTLSGGAELRLTSGGKAELRGQ